MIILLNMKNAEKINKVKKKFYPVIHVEDLRQTLLNADHAYGNGADGIFLINHTVSVHSLQEIYREVRKKYPDQWIGLNFLGLEAEEAMAAVPADANGLWTDNAEIDEFGENIAPGEWFVNFYETHPQCTYFGGVAFKYQRHVAELELAARKAAACMDVICTSGAGTGIAAAVEHVRRFAAVKGETPLALASGVTPDNIPDFLPYADYFLVATGISKSFRMLDPDKIKKLVERVKEYNEKST